MTPSRATSPADSEMISVTIERLPNVTLVRIKGEARVRHVDELERQLRPIAALRPTPPLLVVDLSQLSFISSLGLGLLVELQRGVTRNGGTVRFASPQPAVEDVITKCGLDMVLKLFPDVNSALVPATTGSANEQA